MHSLNRLAKQSATMTRRAAAGSSRNASGYYRLGNFDPRRAPQQRQESSAKNAMALNNNLNIQYSPPKYNSPKFPFALNPLNNNRLPRSSSSFKVSSELATKVWKRWGVDIGQAVRMCEEALKKPAEFIEKVLIRARHTNPTLETNHRRHLVKLLKEQNTPGKLLPSMLAQQILVNKKGPYNHQREFQKIVREFIGMKESVGKNERMYNAFSR